MTRDLNATLKAKLQGAEIKPTVLLSIATGTSPATIYVTTSEVDLVYPTAGQTYTARPMTVPDLMISGTEARAGAIEFGDADHFWQTWLESTDFRFCRVEMRLVERDTLGSATYRRLDTLRVRRVDRMPRSVTFMIEPLTGILGAVKIPKRTLSRDDFPGLPREGVF